MSAYSAIGLKEWYDHGPGVTLDRIPEPINTPGTVPHYKMPTDSMDGMRLTGSMK